ncbi:transposase [Streptomyces violascens]|uniref:transposase n=1 Tax=Streptomyces violascens TaxID=67381 RepID=UPI0036B53144
MLTDVALFLGGRPGARLADRMAVSTGKGTMLRLIRSLPVPSTGPVEVLGVDELALRRRRKYATVLIDMATHGPAGILASRTAGTFAAWLRQHPEVQLICRDRAGCFRDGACAGAPQARPVAGIWHVLRNQAETVERTVGRHRVDLRDPLPTWVDATPAGQTAAGEPDIHGRPQD